MHSETAPPFIRFHDLTRPVGPYDLALELAGTIDRVLEVVPARHRLRDRLDHGSFELVMELANAANDVRSRRWRHYRRALKLATECAAMLDMIERQVAKAHLELELARSTVRRLSEALSPLANAAT
jgi:hypothetical protein